MDHIERRKELRDLMAKHNVDVQEVANILERSAGTVANWRSDTKERLAPPKNELRLLKFELEARKAQNEKTPAATNS